MRAIWSEAPPAPAATTISTGLVGSHAAAGPAASANASVTPAARQVFLVIVSSLGVVGASPQGRPSARCCSALCRFTPLVQGRREPSREPRLFAAQANQPRLPGGSAVRLPAGETLPVSVQRLSQPWASKTQSE